jgi:hypothetical protein
MSGTLTINGAYMTGAAVTTALLSIADGSPTVNLTNFKIVNGQIQSDSADAPIVHLQNGDITTGRIVLIRCQGSVQGITQTGDNTLPGLELWGCYNMHVSNCYFSGNTKGIMLVPDNVSSDPNEHITLNGITLKTNSTSGLEIRDSCTVHVNNFTAEGSAVTSPLVSIISPYTPNLYLTNFELVNGRIQVPTGCGGTYHISNGRISTGHMVFYNCTDSSISDIWETGTDAVNGIEMRGCQRFKVSNVYLKDNVYGILMLDGAGAVHSTDNMFCNIYTDGHSGGAYKEYDANQDYNMLSNFNSRNDDTPMTINGVHTIIRNNLGHVTENSGTGSITSGSTSDVITHGCSFTPTAADITITLTENPTNTPGAIWVDTIGATYFTVNCENDPGASNLDFSWSVRKH